MAEPVEPAWYPDPDGAGNERWWDGISWTSHARERQTSTDPGLQDIAPGWYPDPGGASHERWWDGLRWTDGVRAVQAEPVKDERTDVRTPAAARVLALLASVIFLGAGIHMASLRSVAGTTVAESFYNGIGWVSIATALLVLASSIRWP